MIMKKEKGDKYSMTLAEELQEDWVREKIKNEEITLEREE